MLPSHSVSKKAWISSDFSSIYESSKKSRLNSFVTAEAAWLNFQPKSLSKSYFLCADLVVTPHIMKVLREEFLTATTIGLILYRLRCSL